MDFHDRKMKEMLADFLPLLKCFKCHDFPAPQAQSANRYTCLDESHSLCEKCKEKCPCDSKVSTKPSKIVKKLLQKLPWICPHFDKGCRESKFRFQDWEDHRKNCYFRKVRCPQLFCTEKFSLLKLYDHLSCHTRPFKLPEKLSASKFKMEFKFQHWFENSGWMEPYLLKTTYNGDFFVNGVIKNKIVHFWVSINGSLDESLRFSTTMEASGTEKFQYEGLKSFKSMYRGPVLTLEHEDYKEVIKNGKSWTLKYSIARKLIDEENRLFLIVSIHSIKDEYKDEDVESDVSDKEF